MVRYIALLTLMLLVACAAPAPPTPTPTPQRTSTPVVRTVGPSPTVAVAASPSPVGATTAPAAGSPRVEVLKSANAAFASGDLAGASGLYERVLNTPPTGEAAADQQAIDQFARFRAMVALLAIGKEDQGKAQLQAMQKAEPNGALTRLGNQLWDQYSMVGRVRGACSQLQPQVGSQAGPTLQTLRNLGVTVSDGDLCKVPG